METLDTFLDFNCNNALETTSYRCGIKTCRRFNQFSYHVSEKQQCLWDD